MRRKTQFCTSLGAGNRATPGYCQDRVFALGRGKRVYRVAVLHQGKQYWEAAGSDRREAERLDARRKREVAYAGATGSVTRSRSARCGAPRSTMTSR